MTSGPTPTTRRLGIAAALFIAGAELLYAGVLAVGLATLPGPGLPIQDPWFTVMEILILAMAPAFVPLMIAVHAHAPADRKPVALAALVFAALLAGLTMAVHFSVLTLARHPVFAGDARIFAFAWPSVVYALDILAWDVFFPLAVFAAAPAFRGWARWLLLASGVLAFAGLAGVVTGDMAIRNVGIVGYVGVFTPALLVMARDFARAPPGPPT